ncbi:MAG: hypothetical protein AB7F51_06020 [Pseudorhodoplanes sp.]
MSDEPGALSLRASPPTEADYDKIYNAVMETERGRWFLVEYAKRNRHADTSLLLAAIERIEATLRFQKAATLTAAQPLSALQPELEDLKAAIVRARDNLSAIGPDGALDDKAANFSDIAESLRQASLQVRAAAGRILEEGLSADGLQPGDVQAHTTDIADACLAIEHLAAQSQQLATLLHTIEDRIDLVLSYSDSAQAPQRHETARPAEAARPERSEAPAPGPAAPPAEAADERAIAAGPEWTPPIIQTNGATPALLDPALSPAAPIKGPSGWISKLAPVVSYTARFSRETEGGAATRADDAAATTAPLVDRTAIRDKIAARTASIFDAYFPASDSFKFDADAIPPVEPEAARKDLADESAATAAADPLPEPAAAKNEEPEPDERDFDLQDETETDEAETDEAEADKSVGVATASVEESVPETAAPIAEDAVPDATDDDAAPDETAKTESAFSLSLMEALEREIAAPWPDVAPTPVLNLEPLKEEDAAKTDESVGEAAVREAAAPAPAEDSGTATGDGAAEDRSAEPIPQLAALEAALESFTTSVFENRYTKQPAMPPVAPPPDSSVLETFSAPLADAPPEPGIAVVPGLPETPEPPAAPARFAGGSPTRAARRPQPLPEPAAPTGLESALDIAPQRWDDDDLFEPLPKSSSTATAPDPVTPAVPSGGSDTVSGAPPMTAMAQSDSPVASFDAADAMPGPAPTIADAATGALAQGGSAGFSRGAAQPAAAQNAAVAVALQGGAAAAIRRPAPALAPGYGSRGFRADRPGGNGRTGAGRLATPSPSDDPAAPAAPQADDPLAPVRALSEEEKIALFS